MTSSRLQLQIFDGNQFKTFVTGNCVLDRDRSDVKRTHGYVGRYSRKTFKLSRPRFLCKTCVITVYGGMSSVRSVLIYSLGFVIFEDECEETSGKSDYDARSKDICSLF